MSLPGTMLTDVFYETGQGLQEGFVDPAEPQVFTTPIQANVPASWNDLSPAEVITKVQHAAIRRAAALDGPFSMVPWTRAGQTQFHRTWTSFCTLDRFSITPIANPVQFYSLPNSDPDTRRFVETEVYSAMSLKQEEEDWTTLYWRLGFVLEQAIWWGEDKQDSGISAGWIPTQLEAIPDVARAPLRTLVARPPSPEALSVQWILNYQVHPLFQEVLPAAETVWIPSRNVDAGIRVEWRTDPVATWFAFGEPIRWETPIHRGISWMGAAAVLDPSAFTLVSYS